MIQVNEKLRGDLNRQILAPAITLRILHIDVDEKEFLILKRCLEEVDESIKITSTSSQEEAMLLLKEQTFDCVVSEYHTRRMSGIELARKIREKHDIPIILYAYEDEQVASAAFEAGVDDYLWKELGQSHFQVLAEKIRLAVEKRA